MNEITEYNESIITKIINRFKRLKQIVKDTYYTYTRHDDERYCTANNKSIDFVLARIIRKIVKTCQWIILLGIAIPTFMYCVIQMDMAGMTGYFPDFVNTRVSSLDKAALPLVFHEKQGHPVILFIIWCMMFRFTIRFICAIFNMLRKKQGAWVGAADVMILSILFFCSMNSVFVYWFPFILGFLEFNMNVFSGKKEHGFKLFDINGNFVGRIEKY